jgi:predicted negative regulator of RcsB-dependent stress response
VEATLNANGIDAAVARYRSLREESPQNYNFREAELDELGFDLLEKEQFDESIAVLQLNADQFPQSFTAFDSLGDAYAEAGKDAEAIQSYQRSLSIFSDPANQSRPKLEALQQKARGR